MAENSSSSGGIGFMSALGLLFIGLKLAHVIDWSWWWVLAPFWGFIPVIFVLVVIVLIFKLIAELL